VRGIEVGRIPEGMKWCPHCSGYGSSLTEAAGRCTRCSGCVLVGRTASGRSRAATASPPSGASERSRLVVDREGLVVPGGCWPDGRMYDLASQMSGRGVVAEPRGEAS
jgi:hypothetical protein